MKRQLPEPAATVPIAKKARVDTGPPATDTLAFTPASDFGLVDGLTLLLQKHRLVKITPTAVVGSNRVLRHFTVQEQFAGVAVYDEAVGFLSVGLHAYPPARVDRDAFAMALLADLQKHGIAVDFARLILPPSTPHAFHILTLPPSRITTSGAIIPAIVIEEDMDSSV